MTTTADIWPTFLDFWDLYDYKLDRNRCEKMWNKLSQADKEMAMRHTERYVQSTFTDGRFPSRRHPGTYLHNHNWHDEALIRQAQAKKSKTNGNRTQYALSSAEALARKLADREG